MGGGLRVDGSVGRTEMPQFAEEKHHPSSKKARTVRSKALAPRGLFGWMGRPGEDRKIDGPLLKIQIWGMERGESFERRRKGKKNPLIKRDRSSGRAFFQGRSEGGSVEFQRRKGLFSLRHELSRVSAYCLHNFLSHPPAVSPMWLPGLPPLLFPRHAICGGSSVRPSFRGGGGGRL